MKRSSLILLIAVSAWTGCAPAQTGGHIVTAPDGRQWQSLTVERIADLPVPRGGHKTILAGDEVVILGGLTDGYKNMESADYYADGTWHTVPMLYTHVNGFLAPLPDGRFLLGGGSQEDFGIGQSWGAEIYDPSSHTFTSAGILSAKRAQPSALTLPDGSVVIAGNWYADDSYETWSPEEGFVPGGPLTPGWAKPYILPASRDDIMVFGRMDTRGDSTAGRVDHIGGDTEYIPLLEEWKVDLKEFFAPEDFQVADYTYMVPVRNWETSECAVMKVESGAFSLLEMDAPLPSQGPQGEPIWWGDLQVDRPGRLIWLQGYDTGGRVCFARIGYDATFDGGKASATYFYSENPGGFPLGAARLLSGGRLMLAGGVGRIGDSDPFLMDCFKAFSSAYIFHTEPVQNSGIPLWAYVLGVLVIGGGIFLIYKWLRKMNKDAEALVPEEDHRLTQNLTEQISALIEEKGLYLRKDLRITDLASELATNKTYVSLLLNNISGSSFTNIVNGYRVRHAQNLMQKHPDMLLDDVAAESGFASYTSFYRNFKAITGMTPQDWKKKE